MKNTVDIEVAYGTALTANYIAFQNPDYSNKWFFAFIDDVEMDDELEELASSEEKEEKDDWEEERRQRQEYWATVKYAKSQLYDYYGTGAHFCPAMYSMLGEIKRWSPEQILEEASRNGLI